MSPFFISRQLDLFSVLILFCSLFAAANSAAARDLHVDSSGGDDAAEVVHLSTNDGAEFGVWPGIPDKPVPALFVMATTIDTTLGGPIYRQSGNELGLEGYVCITVDLPCHGKQIRSNEPDGLSGWRHRCEAMENPMAELSQRLSKVLDHLIATGLVDPDRVAACGTSRGGFAALHFAAADRRVKCVAAFSPVTDLTALREFHGAENNPLVQQLAADQLAVPLADRAVWLIIGDRDQRVSTDACVRFARRVTESALAQNVSPQVELHVIPEPGGHTTPAVGPSMAAEWIRRHFQNVIDSKAPSDTAPPQ